MTKTFAFTGMIAASALALFLTGCEQGTDHSSEISMLTLENSTQADEISELKEELKQFKEALANAGGNNGVTQGALELVKDEQLARMSGLEGRIEELEGADHGLTLSSEQMNALAEKLKEQGVAGGGATADEVVAKLKADEEAAAEAARVEREAAEAKRNERFEQLTASLFTDYPKLTKTTDRGVMMRQMFTLPQEYGRDESVKISSRMMRAMALSRTDLSDAAVSTIDSAEQTFWEKRIDTYSRLKDGQITEDVAKIEREAAEKDRDAILESSLSPEELKEYQEAGAGGGRGMGAMLTPERALDFADQMANGEGFGGFGGGGNRGGGNG